MADDGGAMAPTMTRTSRSGDPRGGGAWTMPMNLRKKLVELSPGERFQLDDIRYVVVPGGDEKIGMVLARALEGAPGPYLLRGSAVVLVLGDAPGSLEAP
jgi:hypothetical protein